MKPVHLDFTTLYGAALALEENELRNTGLPLSRLLNLSQLVESIVLMDKLQYELGKTPDWLPYSDAFRKTTLSKFANSYKKFPLKPFTEQVDTDEDLIFESVLDALNDIFAIPIKQLRWAVSFRGGTYSHFKFTKDADNPLLKKYLTIALDKNSNLIEKKYNIALDYLNTKSIGKLGLHVLIRIYLINKFLNKTDSADYFPHFSRQPIIVTPFSKQKELHEWNLKRINETREKILKTNEPKIKLSLLEKSLSPVFLVCLSDAKRPMDIIENALNLRKASYTKEYREEIKSIFDIKNVNNKDIQLYKTRIGLAVNNLNDFLFEKGTKEEYQRRWIAKPLGFSIGWHFIKIKSFKKNRYIGDKSKTFLSDILSQSLGILKYEDKIESIFRTKIKFDSNLISSAVPSEKIVL